MDRSLPGQNRRSQSEAVEITSILANKAGSSIRRSESRVMSEWLRPIIDDLSMKSLQVFPAGQISDVLPRLIASFARHVESGGSVSAEDSRQIDEIAGCIASLRQEEPELAKVVEDYAHLKSLLLEAAAKGLRHSDRAVMDIASSLDEGFYRVLNAGLRAYLERHSLELKRLADTDPLTGLFNVRYFRQQLHRQLELYKRYRIPFSLLMLDLDELKKVNDVRGHECGDIALRNLAAILKQEKRETDIAVRYGGDEFFLLLPGTGTADGERLGRRISRRVKELNMQTHGAGITGVSIGIVSCPDNGTDVGSLRSRADRAMYLAKTLGGGTVARYRNFYET